MTEILRVTDAGNATSVVHVAVAVDHVWTVTVPTWVALGGDLDAIAAKAQADYDRRQRLLKGDGE